MPSMRDQKLVRARSSNRMAPSSPSELAPPAALPESGSDEIGRKLPDAVVDEVLAGARSEKEIVGAGGLLSQFSKRLVERALEVEITVDRYERHQEPPEG